METFQWDGVEDTSTGWGWRHFSGMGLKTLQQDEVGDTSAGRLAAGCRHEGNRMKAGRFAAGCRHVGNRMKAVRQAAGCRHEVNRMQAGDKHEREIEEKDGIQ